FAVCASIWQDIINGEYGVYEIYNTWGGPHGFVNDRCAEIILAAPSKGGSTTDAAWLWYWRYFYHQESGKYFGGVSGNGAPYNGFMLSPSRKPTGQIYTEFKLGNPYEKFHDNDLRKKPFVYSGNKHYEG